MLRPAWQKERRGAGTYPMRHIQDMTRFSIITAPPKGRGTLAPNKAAKMQASLFAAVAMMVAGNEEAKGLLMRAIEDAEAAGPGAQVA